VNVFFRGISIAASSPKNHTCARCTFLTRSTPNYINRVVPHSSLSWNSYLPVRKERLLVLRQLDSTVFTSPDEWCRVVVGLKSWLQQSRAVCTCSGLPFNRQKYNLAKTTNICTEFYHFFIQYTGSYMFQQWSVIIRELLGFVWATYLNNLLQSVQLHLSVYF
jgi:hypothetical protein